MSAIFVESTCADPIICLSITLRFQGLLCDVATPPAGSREFVGLCASRTSWIKMDERNLKGKYRRIQMDERNLKCMLSYSHLSDSLDFYELIDGLP